MGINKHLAAKFIRDLDCGLDEDDHGRDFLTASRQV
jgi:hypothetical protein